MHWITICRTSTYVSPADPRLACPEPDGPVSRLGHAWLLLGDPGLGKDQLAERLARLHLCQQPDRGEPCGQCHSCQLFDKGNHPDLGTITRDSKTIGVEAIREICTRLQGSAQLGRGKVVIIPDAERMTESAANALLKTTEEPAGDSLLLLIASQFPGCFPPFSVAVTNMSVGSCGRETVRWLAEQGHQATLAQVRICQGHRCGYSTISSSNRTVLAANCWNSLSL